MTAGTGVPAARMNKRARFFAAAVAVSGCTGELEPCEGVVDGATYQIQVGQPLPNEDMPECHKAWGLGEGTTFSVRLADVAGDFDCKSGVPELTGPEGWTFARRSTDTMGGIFLEGHYDGVFNNCPVDVTLRVSAASEPGLSCFSEGGATSGCVMSWILDPRDPAMCSSFCGTRLSATVTRH